MLVNLAIFVRFFLTTVYEASRSHLFVYYSRNIFIELCEWFADRRMFREGMYIYIR